MRTDSTSVLQWLNSSSKLPVFVANRVSEILESTTIDELFHVSSGDNLVDTGTRGTTAEALKESGLVKCPFFEKPKTGLLNLTQTCSPKRMTCK